MKEIPVYLFLGFLDSGKTTFLQGTLEDERFNAGERTLLLLCEQGETEINPSRFAYPNVVTETLDRIEQINADKLYALCKKANAERVIIEYNGMWQAKDLLAAFPECFMLAQCLAFFDASVFDVYNANMRSLVVDKLTYCDLAVFNRVPVGTDTMPLHKIVRGVTRRSDIAYEFTDGSNVYDDTEDPLPFDKTADFIEIADRDYALWYRDLSENADDYENKTVRFLAVVAADGKLPPNGFFVGRHVMTCCEADISYHGLLCLAENVAVKSYDWVTVTARIKIEKNKLYRQRGPVLYAESVTPAEKPEQPVATFY